MGLLTPSPPAWHPAPAPLREATAAAVKLCAEEGWEGGLPDIALGYAMRDEYALPAAKEEGSAAGTNGIPVVVGLSTPAEVHQAVKAWRAIHEADASAISKRRQMEQKIVELYEKLGYYDWSWASPPRKD